MRPAGAFVSRFPRLFGRLTRCTLPRRTSFARAGSTSALRVMTGGSVTRLSRWGFSFTVCTLFEGQHEPRSAGNGSVEAIATAQLLLDQSEFADEPC